MPETLAAPASTPVKMEDFKSPVKPDWCPGCGDFGVLQSLMKAAVAAGVAPHELVVVSGIGCSSNLPGFINAYGVHSLHGRSVAVATGIRLANTSLKVAITGGDGDGYGIGIGHFIHAMRRNLDLTYIVMDNQIYGLTTGQASPTTEIGSKTKSTPDGNIEVPINPIGLALLSGATFVARGFSGEPAHLADLLRQAIQHKGFALVDVFSPCVTYNKINTYPWFKERVYKLEEEKHDASDWKKAVDRSIEWGRRIPIGVFYRQAKPTYEELDPGLRGGPLVKQKVGITKELGVELLKETM